MCWETHIFVIRLAQVMNSPQATSGVDVIGPGSPSTSITSLQTVAIEVPDADEEAVEMRGSETEALVRQSISWCLVEISVEGVFATFVADSSSDESTSPNCKVLFLKIFGDFCWRDPVSMGSSI